MKITLQWGLDCKRPNKISFLRYHFVIEGFENQESWDKDEAIQHYVILSIRYIQIIIHIQLSEQKSRHKISNTIETFIHFVKVNQ